MVFGPGYFVRHPVGGREEVRESVAADGVHSEVLVQAEVLFEAVVVLLEECFGVAVLPVEVVSGDGVDEDYDEV